MATDAGGPPRGRWLVRGLLAFALVALIAAIVEIATQNASPEVERIKAINETQRIFGGIRQAGDRLGSPDAPVQITFFDDVQCSDCAGHFTKVVPPLVEELVRDDEAKLVYRHFSQGTKPEQLGFFAAEAAADQGYQWHYVFLFFSNQDQVTGPVDEDFLRNLASSIGELEIEEWEDDLAAGLEPDSEVRGELEEDATLAEAFELPPGSVKVVGPQEDRELTDFPSAARILAAVEAVS